MKKHTTVKSDQKTIKLDGKITLLSPLSHIGESWGVDSFLSTDQVIGKDGQPAEVFLYSGNSFRGILRDMAAKYLLNKLGGLTIPLETFHLLFSGGSIGGEQSIDINQARLYRKMLPAFSIFGGGIGNQIMEGKLKIGCMYPLVKECQRVLPEKYRDENAPSWRKWTYEKSHTRRDDSKQENMRKYITEDTLLLKNKESESVANKEKEDKNAPSTQMRYTVELFATGAVMYQRIYLQDMTELELGAFVSALCEFQKMPFLGGKSGTGHGQCEIEYEYEPGSVFLSATADNLYLSNPAGDAKNTYDDFLLKLYNQYLTNCAPELTKLLGE